MRKKQTHNPLQLSLFDDAIPEEKKEKPKSRLDAEWENAVNKPKLANDNSLINHKTQNHERNISESKRRERENLHPSHRRGYGDNARPFGDGGHPIQDDERTTTGKVKGDERERPGGSLFEQGSGRVRPESSLEHSGRTHENIRGGRDGMAEADGGSRVHLTDLKHLLDCEIVDTAERDITFGRRYHNLFRASPTTNFIARVDVAASHPEIKNPLFLHFTQKKVSEEDIYKRVFDNYRETVEINNATRGRDQWFQALFDHAGSVITNVNRALAEEKKKEPQQEVAASIQDDFKVQNFHATTSPLQGRSFNKSSRYQGNIEALDVLIDLQKDARYPTEKEQQKLAQYVGWGGLKEIQLNPEKEDDWKSQSDIKLRESVKAVNDKLNTLDPDGSLGLLENAKRSILSAHYTSYDIINAIYKTVQNAGFSGGNLLEPSAGIGNFLAAMPEDMANNSEVTAIEMDQTSGKILRNLFPTAETYISPFEKTQLPENHYDLILSNIPFGSTRIFDPLIENNKDRDFKKAANNIHNYFFAKSILLAKPGAMIAFVTSRYTLDSKKNHKIRELINDNCDFCGAIRLPDNAFKSNAGTEVVSDIIFLRKFRLGENREQKNQFLNVKDKPFTDQKGQSGIISYNEYFHDHPEHLIGTVEFGGLYRDDEFNLKGNAEQNFYEEITRRGEELFKDPVLIVNPNTPIEQTKREAEIEHYISMKEYDAIGNLVVLQDGFIGKISANFHVNQELDDKVRLLGLNPNVIRNNRDSLSAQDEQRIKDAGIDIEDFYDRVVQPVRIRKADQPKIKFLSTLRERTKEIIYKETTGGYSDFALDNLRKELRSIYNDFTNRYNHLSHKSNKKIIEKEIDNPLLRSLETYNKEKNRYAPSDILFKRTVNPIKEVNRTDNIQDAISLSLRKFGTLKINYIAELMNKSHEEIMKAQTGDHTYIFKDINGAFKTREEYLSGNVVKKLKEAKKAAEMDGYFQNNVEQLEKVQPDRIPAVDIYSPLHSRWVPQNYIQQFLQHLLHTDEVQLKFSNSKDNYKLNINDYGANLDAFSSKRKKASWIIEQALNGTEPKVNYSIEENGVRKTVFDAEDTQLAKEIYKKIQGEWDDWKYQDLKRREYLENIYNSTFNTTVLRKYDGANMKFPGLIGFDLRPHQKDVVFRNVQQMGGINDHMVGAGKTLVQIATAMELRRLGLANKPMIIGLKSQIPQLYNDFKEAYPLAKVLYPDTKDFQASNRKRLLANIATNDWDCVIISHDQFTRIEQPEDIQIELKEELMTKLKEDIAAATDKREKKRLENRLYAEEQKVEKLSNAEKDRDVPSFDQLGIDFLMVDESQEFKNLEFSTSKKNIKGLGNPDGSKRAFNMLVAARYLQKKHGGDKGLLFASGTPISNTMAELYLLFKYLRPDKMKELQLTSFDRWAANFANDYSDLEYYMGKFKEVHRFREFVNLPELLTLYREIADVRNDNNLKLDKPACDHQLVKIQPSEKQLDLINKLQEYIGTKGVKNASELGLTAGFDDRKGMNPSYAILAINFAKKLSLDPRLISPNLNPGTKLASAAENISNIYSKYDDIKGTQLVFCDVGTPKSKNKVNNLYNFLASGDIAQADLNAVFGADFLEKKAKPRINTIKARMANTLHLSESETENMVAEANRNEDFSVYSEMKRLLMRKGIPSEEIAFIHDYNTRKQKDELFDKVNKGDVRVLLGSTKKLGTGVNVQKLAVAGHHLDITWRPSDIEQRNGRIGRQGNEAAKLKGMKEVPIYYYATERTLDASMYNTTSQKAKFIAQLKTTTNNDLRTIKDLEEDIDMGDMAAELSGDPIFKEKATLTKKVQELEQLEKSFKGKKFSFESKLKESKTLLRYYDDRVTILNRNIPLLKNIPRNEKGEEVFAAKMKNNTFSKMKEYGTQVVAEAEYFKNNGRRDQRFDLGQVWGYKVVGTVANQKGDLFDARADREVISPLGDSIAPKKAIVNGTVAAAVQIRNAILDMPKRLETIQTKIKRQNGNVEKYNRKIAEPFAYKEELNIKRNRLTEVNGIIKEKLKEENKRENRDMERTPSNQGGKEEMPVCPIGKDRTVRAL